MKEDLKGRVGWVRPVRGLSAFHRIRPTHTSLRVHYKAKHPGEEPPPG